MIEKSGKLFLNGEPSDAAGIAARCKEVSRQDPKAQAIIAADKLTSHGQVVKVIDLVRRNGVQKFAINVDPESMLNTTSNGDSRNPDKTN